MELVLKDTTNKLKFGFLEWFCGKIKDDIIHNLDLKKLQKWDKYLNSVAQLRSIYKKKISTKEIIWIAVNNLIFKSFPSIKVIEINPTILVPNLDNIKLVSICKLINYGNQEIAGYNIFSSSFDSVKDNLQKYIDQYLYGVG